MQNRDIGNALTDGRGTGASAVPGGATPLLARRAAQTTILYLYDGTQSEADAHAAKQAARRIYGAVEARIRPFRTWSAFQKLVTGYDEIGTLVIDTHGESDEFMLSSGEKRTIKDVAALFEKTRPKTIGELAIEGCTLGLYPADLAVLAKQLRAKHVRAWLWSRVIKSASVQIPRDATSEDVAAVITRHEELGPQFIKYLMPGDEPARLASSRGTRRVWFEWFDPTGLDPPDARQLGRFLTRKETETKIDTFTDREAPARQRDYDGDPFLLALRQFGPQPFARISLKISPEQGVPKESAPVPSPAPFRRPPPTPTDRGTQSRAIESNGIARRSTPSRGAVLAAQEANPRDTVPCVQIPLDWRKIRPVLAKLEISKRFGLTLVHTEYEGWIESELHVSFTLRDRAIEAGITGWVIARLEEEGVTGEDLAVLKRLEREGVRATGQGSEVDVLDAVEAAFGPERLEAFRRLRPLLLKYVSQSALATRWIYLEKAKIPAPRSDHASVIRETVSVTEETHTARDVEVFRDDVEQHVALLEDVFPLLVTCDEKLRKDWERHQHLFQPAMEKIGRWAERWRKVPRTKAGLVTPSRFRITERSLRGMIRGGVPPATVRSLRPLLNQKFEDEELFLAAVRAAIGSGTAFLTFKGVVLASAERSGGTTPVATASYPVDVDYEHMNPEKIRDCLAKKEFCPLRVHFEHNRPAVRAETDAALARPQEMERILESLRFLFSYGKEPLKITIRGYTDRSGGRAQNQALSERRAQWLFDRIQKDFDGSHFRNVELLGHGERGAAPQPEDSPEDRFAEIMVEPIR